MYQYLSMIFFLSISKESGMNIRLIVIIFITIVILVIASHMLYNKQNSLEKFFQQDVSDIVSLQTGSAEFERLGRMETDLANTIINTDNNAKSIQTLKADGDKWYSTLSTNTAQYQKDANAKLATLQAQQKIISKNSADFNPKLVTLDEAQNNISSDTQVINGKLMDLHNLVGDKFATYDEQISDINTQQSGIESKFTSKYTSLVTDAYNTISTFQTNTRASLNDVRSRLDTTNSDFNSWAKDFAEFKGASTKSQQTNQTSLNQLKENSKELQKSLTNAYAKIDNVKDALKGYIANSDMANFVAKSDMTNYPTRNELSSYATKSDIGNYTSQQEINTYALRSEFQSVAETVANTKTTLDNLKATVDSVASDYINTPTFNKRVVELTGSDKIKANLDDARRRIAGYEQTINALPNAYVPQAQFTMLAENSINLPALRKTVSDLQTSIKTSRDTLTNIQNTYLDKSKIGNVAIEATGSVELSNRITKAIADLRNLETLVNSINSNYVTKANLPQLARDASGVTALTSALQGTNAQIGTMIAKISSLEGGGYVYSKDIPSLAVKITGSEALKTNVDALTKTVADATTRLATLEKDYVTKTELQSIAATPARAETIATSVATLNENVKKLNADISNILSSNFVRKADVAQLASDATGINGMKDTLKTLIESVNKLANALDNITNLVTSSYVTKADFANQLQGYLLKTDLANYALKTDFTNFASRVEADGVTKNLANTYVAKGDMQNYALKTDLASVATKADLNMNTQKVIDQVKALRASPDELCLGGLCLSKDEWARIKEAVAPKNCILSVWSAWSACDNNTGKKRRTRSITQQPTNGGAPCQAVEELANCDPIDCVLSPWSQCSAVCGQGTQTRTIVTQPRYGGKACEALTQNCTGTCPFRSHRFTNCGKKGRLGPTLDMCKSAYASSGWVNNTNIFNMRIQGIQLFTIQVSGVYRITCGGAEGHGNGGSWAGGKGAIIRGDFNLTQGEVICIVVGQQGLSSGGGGGGTFVYKEANNTVLIIAGGGGGGAHNDGFGGGGSASLWPSSGGGSGSGGYSNQSYGGWGGQCSVNCVRDSWNGAAGGGCGWNGDGRNGVTNNGNRYGIGGGSRSSNFVGGYYSDSPQDESSGNGGFGGGGGCGGHGFSGGGGGGYTGGGGGNNWNNINHGGGQGGGSLNNGSNQSNTVGSNSGHGYALFELL